LGPIPNPQSPIPNPQSPLYFIFNCYKNYIFMKENKSSKYNYHFLLI